MKIGNQPRSSVLRNLHISIVDLLLQVLGILSVNGAPNRNTRAEDLLHGTSQLLSHGARPHHLGDLDNIIQGDIPVVLDVLRLLTVALGLLE